MIVPPESITPELFRSMGDREYCQVSGVAVSSGVWASSGLLVVSRRPGWTLFRFEPYLHQPTPAAGFMEGEEVQAVVLLPSRPIRFSGVVQVSRSLVVMINSGLRGGETQAYRWDPLEGLE